jgi:Lon protease-like protein
MDREQLERKLTSPVPLFPLHQVVLFPHAVAPLRVFEPRYRQMVDDAMAGDKLLAMATFAGDRWKREYHGRPPLRPAVCVGQIVQEVHEAEGRSVIILQGLCRARIAFELPAKENRLYREAMLEPIEEAADDQSLAHFRETFADALESKPLCDFRHAAALAEHLREPDLPAAAVLEMVTISFVDELESRYRLLAEPDPESRARLLSRELAGLAQLLRRAEPQRRVERPKGCHWN